MHVGQARSVVERAIQVRVPIMLWGPPGVGKSSLVRSIANDHGIELKDIRLAQMDPVDLRGVLLPNNDKSSVDWILPALWPQGGEGIIFLDEIEKAPRSVKAAALQLVLDRKIGDYVLPDGWAIVCAGNPDDVLSSQMGDALNNRMVHIYVESNTEAWLVWAKQAGIDDRVIGFISFRKDLLYKSTGHEAFPSPRSWEMASKLISDITDVGPYITAAVGEGTAVEFMAWYDMFRHVKPEDILYKGRLPDIQDNDLGFTYAVITSVAMTYKELRREDRDKVAPNLAKLFDVVPTEFILLFVRFMPDTEKGIFAHPALRKFTDVLMDALDYV